MVIQFSTSAGNLANSRVTVQNGEADVTFISETKTSQVVAKVDAQINEASNDYKALIGKVFGTTNITLTPSGTDISTKAILTGAESDIADRVTLHFNKAVSVKNFVKQNLDGTYIVDASGNASAYAGNDGGYGISVTQPGTAPFAIRGFQSVANDPNSIVVILQKTNTLTDNNTVNVDLIDATGVHSTQSFVLTDPRPAEPTSVAAQGLTGVNVVFSEPIAPPDISQLRIDAGKLDLTNIDPIAPAISIVSTGDFDQNKFTDTRNVLSLNFGTYDTAVAAANSIDGKDHAANSQVFLNAGSHSIQLAAIKDFAGLTDTKNISTTQTLNFTVQGNDVVPAVASVVAESPEQFRVKFNCDIAGTPAMTLYAYNSTTSKYDVFTNIAIDSTHGNLVDPTGGNILDVKKVSDSEYVVQLAADWTLIYNTTVTNKNYYNGKYALHFAADALANPANGKTSGAAFDAPITGDALTTADVTSPVIANIVAAHDNTANAYDVIMSEPVKVGVDPVTSADGDATISQTQLQLPTTTVQFLGKDASGNTVTVDGTVIPYNTDESSGDKVFKVVPNTVGGKTIQQLVNDGTYQGNWTVVVKSISDDVGNTAATLTKAFTLTKTAGAEDFYALPNGFKVDLKGANPDELYVTFTAPVTVTGNTENAANVSNYTLDGNLLPKDSIITLTSDIGADDGIKDNTILIKLPDGTLSNANKHTLVVAKSLKSALGTAYNTTHAVQFVLPDATVVTTGVTAGPVAITQGDAGTSTAASQTLTVSTVPADGDELTIGDKTVGFKATASPATGADFDIDITINNTDIMVADAIEALNLGGTVVVKTGAVSGNTTVELVAATAGTAGNALTTANTVGTAFTGVGALTGGTAGVGAVTEYADLTIATPATTTGNVTVTVNGTAYTVAVVAGDTAAQVATKIYAQLTNVTGYTVTNPSAGVVRFTSTTANTNVADLIATVQ